MQNIQDHIQNISNKTFIIRCNFDVPIKNHTPEDTTRIEDSFKTIELILAHQNRVILIAHAGRPENQDPDLSLDAIKPILESHFNKNVNFIPYQSDYKNIQKPNATISLLENLRYWPEEEANDPSFSQWLATLADYYVNEAFANCHRKHSSIVGIPSHIPSYAGLSLSNEISILSQVRNQPQKPLIVIIGGAKLETKQPLVDIFADKADKILVGGKVALEMKSNPNQVHKDNIIIADLTASGKDITPESAVNFASIIQSAKTVVWNGTMGVFEEPEHANGTKVIAEAVNHTTAFTLVGGGDTETALTVFDQEDHINHISTGGGAMLNYLIDGTLPGIEILK